MTGRYGPWWTNTWWGRRATTANVSLVVVLVLFVVWKALVP